MNRQLHGPYRNKADYKDCYEQPYTTKSDNRWNEQIPEKTQTARTDSRRNKKI